MFRRSLISVLRHERFVVAAGLGAVIVLAWGYLLNGAAMDIGALGEMAMGDAPMGMPAGRWTFGYFVLTFTMWIVMMAAMMLPSAAPMLLFYATINNRRTRPVAMRTAMFALGYVTVWTLFSLAAVLLQWRLEELALLSPMMRMTNGVAAGLVLVAAGLYQWTSLKHACLRQCQSPLDFILAHWREGSAGAFVMGLHHGLFCLGCCWMLMLLLFVGGVMNLLWIGGIALFVLVEKIVRPTRLVTQLAGAVLVLWGGITLL